ncbi:MAG: ABC transporter permease [Acidobacteria bacterium]|nr:ABC transporter permease [Acidobacteriota bacterium]
MRRPPFELYLALRYLTARRKQASIASTSLISILGVLVGVMALVIALALMTGLAQEMRDRIVGASAHVYVWKAGGFDDYREEAKELVRVPGVVAAAPALPGEALAFTRQAQAFVRIKGIDPDLEAEATELATSLTHGRLPDLAVPLPPERRAVGGVVIGDRLAQKLGAFVGDELSVLTTAGTPTPLGVWPRPRRLVVAGIFSLGLLEYDEAFAFVTLDTARRLFNAEGVGMMELRVDDPMASRAVAEGIPERLGPNYVTDDWSRLNAPLFGAMWLEKMGISIAVGLIVVVAALHIIASLVMLVMERSRDIAILKTMGASSRVIRRVFMLQGLIIGAVGTLGGAAAGYLVSTVMDRYRLLQLPMEIYQVSYVPFTVRAVDITVVVVVALVVCFVATVYPSRQASRLDPAEALRYQ